MNPAGNRHGRGLLGCLLTVAVGVFVVICGLRFVPPILHYTQFRDEMRADARFGVSMPDSLMLLRLQALADTLNLPPAAHRVVIRRISGRPSIIRISADYIERVSVPIFGVKQLHFRPVVEEPL